MAFPVPPQIQAAQQQLVGAIQAIEKKQVDPVSTPWAELEKSVIKLLGGAFQVQRPDHQAIALGLAGFFAARLNRENQAFWFPNRDSLEGASIGFPDALIMLSPFGAVVESLSMAKLEHLDDVAKQIRSALAQAKFSVQAAPVRLTPLDYQRLFDPGFLQFVVLDPAKTKSAWESTPEKLTRELRDALSRAGGKLPDEAKQQFEAQIVTALQRLDAQKPVLEQVERAGRVVELIGHLFGTTAGTGAAPEEFWQDLALPLLHIGAPEQFPPLDPEDVDAVKKGVDPTYLFLDVVPYRTPAPEDGLLGLFELSEISLPHPALERVGALRLVKVKPDRLKSLFAGFDPNKTKDAIARFRQYMEEKAGQAVPTEPEAAQVEQAALTLLSDLQKLVATPGDLCIRRITEAEAASEAAIAVVRGVLQGPRIILTT